MDLRRLRVGEWIVGISGVILLVSLFLPWWSLPGNWAGSPGSLEGAYFERSVGASDFGPTTTWDAWQVFQVADVLFALLALLAIAVWAIVARAPAAGLGITVEALVTLLAIPMAIVALVQVLGTPNSLDLSPLIETGTEIGAWLGLAATWGVLVGLLVAMRDERLSKPGRLTDQSGKPVAAPIHVETLPGPPAA